MLFRIERDPLGELQVPADAYYGAQTARAVENFPISGLRAPDDLITATVFIKKAVAEANAALGRLDAGVARAIITAADEVIAGQFRDQFVVDVYQAGAGTSHNMNVNEVLANRAGEILGEPRGTYGRVHPNDHVNMGQSTNDVYPTATRLALLMGAERLVASARALADSLARKADEFADVLKTGRTHLQDAVPITLGQELGGYAECIRSGADDVAAGSEQLRGAEHRRHGGRHRLERRRRLPPARCREPRAGNDADAQAGAEFVSRDAEHGRRAGLLGRDAAPRRGARQGGQRSAAPEHGAAGGLVGDQSAGRATGLVDHAREGESVHAGDGEPGLVPGHRLRHDGRRWRAKRVSWS